MKCGHLERKQILLKTLAPVHIGSGVTLNKKEYIFDAKKELIHFINLPDLYIYLKGRNLLKRYEEFLINSRSNDLRVFLEANGVTEKEYASFVRYSINAGEAARTQKFRGVLTFVKDAEGRPYIPGSSLKGAIRTAITAYFLKKGNYEENRREMERAEYPKNMKYYLKNENRKLEEKIFYRLGIKNSRDGREISSPINDFMQGIRISDSAPLDFGNMILTGKHDRKPDGTINLISIFRESLVPGCEARMSMTLDLPMLSKVGLGTDSIEKALHSFADDHYENFERYFEESSEDASISTTEGVDLFLGGGTGYASKTVMYNLYEKRESALTMVSKYMIKAFPKNHGHYRDFSEYKVSPHILKTAMYSGRYYQMGRCEIIIK